MSRPSRNNLRQRNTTFVFIPWRRATADTKTSGTKVSLQNLQLKIQALTPAGHGRQQASFAIFFPTLEAIVPLIQIGVHLHLGGYLIGRHSFPRR